MASYLSTSRKLSVLVLVALLAAGATTGVLAVDAGSDDGFNEHLASQETEQISSKPKNQMRATGKERELEALVRKLEAEKKDLLKKNGPIKDEKRRIGESA